MGQEEKKSEGKKVEESKKVDEHEGKKDNESKAEKPSEQKKGEDSNEASGKDSAPPPAEVVLRVYMHCEGCAKKVRRCLKGFEGVEDVLTDCKAHKVVVKGEKVDPLKVLETLQRKSHRQVELLSPIPPPPPPPEEEGEVKKPEEKEAPKPEEKAPELQVITVVLRVYMHCEACALEIKKRMQRMKGVETAEPDLKSSQVRVKGAFEAPKLVEYVYKRTGKQAVIVKIEPENDDVVEIKGKEEKKAEDGGHGDEEEKTKAEDDCVGKEKEKSGRGGDGGDGGDGNGKGGEEPGAGGGEGTAANGEAEKVDPTSELVKKNNELCNENYQQIYNHQVSQYHYRQEMSAYPPQIFSDENPNACSIM